jgi:hypothetical protein
MIAMTTMKRIPKIMSLCCVKNEREIIAVGKRKR